MAPGAVRLFHYLAKYYFDKRQISGYLFAEPKRSFMSTIKSGSGESDMPVGEFVLKLWEKVVEVYEATPRGEKPKSLNHPINKWRSLGRVPKWGFVFQYAQECGIDFSLTAEV